MWFKELTGFEEKSPDYVRSNLVIKGENLVSLVTNQQFSFGRLEVPSLEQLRKMSIKEFSDKIQVREIVADVKELHCQIENENALFQVASQFNLLEMVNPDIIPEQGVDRYEYDFTQGPICAISCGAGTIYRNYFVTVNGETGQTANNQINCLDLISKEFNNAELNLWQMKNGYVLTNQEGLKTINQKIGELDEIERENLKGKLKVGIQWNTEVTISETKHKLSQVFCSALPIAYNYISPHYWEPFARVILEATYESTLYAGLMNLKSNRSNIVYLTLIGGGAFGNPEQWIVESMQKAIDKFKHVPLDIRIVSYPKSQQILNNFIDKY